MAQITSIYADVWRALYRLLTTASWPSAGVPNVAPVIGYLGGWGKDTEPVEGALVVTAAKSPDTQDWVVSNAGRDEVFSTDVEIKTAIRNRTAGQALDRLEQLTIVFEQLISAGIRTPPVEVKSRGWWWGITGMECVVWPLADGGYGAAAKFTITVQARVGGTL